MYKLIRECCELWDELFSTRDICKITTIPTEVFIKAKELLEQKHQRTISLSTARVLWDKYNQFGDPPKKVFRFVLMSLLQHQHELHLFKCTQTVNQHYSAYSTLYVIATSEEEARKIHPKSWDTSEFQVWCNSPEEVIVEEIDLKKVSEVNVILTKEMYLEVLDDLK